MWPPDARSGGIERQVRSLDMNAPRPVVTEQPPHPVKNNSPIPVSPILDAMLDEPQAPRTRIVVDSRVLKLCLLALLLGVLMAGMSQVLIRLIYFFTNLSFYGRLSILPVSPSENHLGLWVLVIPVIGGIVVGVMARFGSKAIRGHGIPEAMEQVLTNSSRIPARITILKPLSAAISIGTGGPFGAEGPIIATGGALGSLIGQLLQTNAIERKTLLAAGAAAGMSATFGSPVSAVLLAVELLLFEYRPRSIIPVALASATAAGLRLQIEGHGAMFPMPAMADPSSLALLFYIALGAFVGAVAVGITKIVYGIEDLFEHLPLHWMWWPAIGGLAIGIVGYFYPQTLGVGYANIAGALDATLLPRAALLLFLMKFISWSISLGSGTSGGTLAPLLTLGGCLGSALGLWTQHVLPQLGVDPRVAALVGMAAMFVGAARAFLASIVFAFEITLQPSGLLPLLMGCSAASLASWSLMRFSIMTERIARRGIRTTGEYSADVLGQILVGSIALRTVVVLRSGQTIQEVRKWIADEAEGSSHQGFPVVDDREILVGVITRRNLLHAKLAPERPLKELIAGVPKFVYSDNTLREATEHMVRHDIGRLPVMSRHAPPRLVGILTRSDILQAFRHDLDESRLEPPNLRIGYAPHEQKA